MFSAERARHVQILHKLVTLGQRSGVVTLKPTSLTHTLVRDTILLVHLGSFRSLFLDQKCNGNIRSLTTCCSRRASDRKYWPSGKTSVEIFTLVRAELHMATDIITDRGHDHEKVENGHTHCACWKQSVETLREKHTKRMSSISVGEAFWVK